MNTLSFKTLLPAGIAAFTLLAGCKSGEEKTVAKDTVKTVAAPAPGDPFKLDSSKRYIFLTWDDSPQPPGTNVCMKIFREQNVKATFFSVGLNVSAPGRGRTLDTIRNSYPLFLLANHSHSHGFRDQYKKFYTMPDSAVQDFLLAEQEMKIPVKIIRLPGNNGWVGKDLNKGPQSTKLVRDKLDAMGFKVIGWDVEWQFVKGSQPKQSATEMVNEINKKFDEDYTTEANCMVILAHDRMFAKPPYSDTLTRFITLLKQDPRNVFETIDHYPLVQRK